MTHPKEGDSHRLILEMSYPKGNSLNYHITKALFHGTLFTLKLRSIDPIIPDILNTENDPEVDVASAFRNLPVDPADSLKFGLKVNCQYFLDKSVAFGWVHGTALFKLTSDAVVYFMRDKSSYIAT